MADKHPKATSREPVQTWTRRPSSIPDTKFQYPNKGRHGDPGPSLKQSHKKGS